MPRFLKTLVSKRYLPWLLAALALLIGLVLIAGWKAAALGAVGTAGAALTAAGRATRVSAGRRHADSTRREAAQVDLLNDAARQAVADAETRRAPEPATLGKKGAEARHAADRAADRLRGGKGK
jgi:hypothetical protein